MFHISLSVVVRSFFSLYKLPLSHDSRRRGADDGVTNNDVLRLSFDNLHNADGVVARERVILAADGVVARKLISV